MKSVIFADYLGFCNGVERAVKIAYSALERAKEEKKKLFFYGEVVHNTLVMDTFYSSGALLVSSSAEVEPDSVVVVRAHGITESELKALVKLNSIIFDATCPVVKRSHSLLLSSKKPLIVIGNREHAETAALLGESEEAIGVERPEELEKLDPTLFYNVIVQTTFSSKSLRELKSEGERLGLHLSYLNDICSSSQKRRDAITTLKGRVDALLVVGSEESSNTRELVGCGEQNQIDTFLVSHVSNIPDKVLTYERVGITAGASTPKEQYERVANALLEQIDGE